jgi:hypothetical protein
MIVVFSLLPSILFGIIFSAIAGHSTDQEYDQSQPYILQVMHQEQLNIDYYLDVDQDGVGTTFTFQLPGEPEPTVVTNTADNLHVHLQEIEGTDPQLIVMKPRPQNHNDQWLFIDTNMLSGNEPESHYYLYVPPGTVLYN